MVDQAVRTGRAETLAARPTTNGLNHSIVLEFQKEEKKIRKRVWYESYLHHLLHCMAFRKPWRKLLRRLERPQIFQELALKVIARADHDVVFEQVGVAYCDILDRDPFNPRRLVCTDRGCPVHHC